MTQAAGEIKTQRIITRYDLTDVIGMSLRIERPDGSVANITAGITVGTVPATLEDGTPIAANYYALYTNGASDFPAAGEYRIKLSADFGATKQLKSTYKTVYIEA